MQRLTNAHRAQIYRALADARAPTRYGEVDGYDPKTYCATVIIQPEGIKTGWLPIMAAGSGGGWGDYWGLLPGTQVALSHFEGDRDNGLILGITPNDDEQPPQVPGGEKWTVHKSGSYLKFTNDGKVSLHGTVLIQIGNLQNAVKKFVTDAFVSLFNSHTHSHGAAPDQTMDNSHLTTIVKGN